MRTKKLYHHLIHASLDDDDDDDMKCWYLVGFAKNKTDKYKYKYKYVYSSFFHLFWGKASSIFNPFHLHLQSPSIEKRERKERERKKDKTTWSTSILYWTNTYIEQAKKSALIIHRLPSPGRFHVPVRMM